MISKLQRIQLKLLIEQFSHCMSRFDSSPNEYSERQAADSSEKLNKFINSITEKESEND